jgi:hypothetical protein
MNVASSRAARPDLPLFADGLGERGVARDASTGEALQVLTFAPPLAAVPSFDFAVRERTARLATFRSASFATVRRVERLPDGRLAIVSDHVDGVRVSDLLAGAHARGLPLDTGAAFALIGQLVSAVAVLHENARDVAHGLVAPERLVVTPHARLVIVEHVVGAAVEQLQYGRDRLWREFRAAVPASAGLPRLDHRADVNGIGITALSLVLGRPLSPAEFPHGVAGLVVQACERSSGRERPLPNGLRNWLARTLQLDVRRAFASAPEALAALTEALAAEPSCVPAPVALESYLAAAGVTGSHAPRLDAGAADAPGHGTSRGRAAVRSLPGPAAHDGPGLRRVPRLADLIAVHDLVQETGAGRLDEDDPAEDTPAVDEDVPTAAGTGDTVPAAIEEAARPAAHRDAVAPPATAARERASARPRGWPSRAISIVPIVLALIVAGSGLLGWRMVSSAGAESGTLVVQSSPAGVDVYVDGEHRGVTPARLTVTAGSHILELRGHGVPRVIPLQVPAGGQVSQYLEFADTPRTGMLVVHSQPAGARVTVDGVARGTAPLTIEGLEPGTREVVLQNDRGRSRHTVEILAGTTASLVAPVVTPAASGPVSGWIAVTAPFLVEIFEDGRLVGTTETDRLMLTAGRHVLEFVNRTLGYRETQTVQVPSGRVLPITLNLPSGSVSLNADPWAEVVIDGRSVGETPIGNLELTIGAYEIVFKHPQLGERRHAVSVTTTAPVRLSVSMR